MKWTILTYMVLLVTAGTAVIEAQPYTMPKINEIMSSNKTVLADEDGDYPDWLEIYNPHDQDIDLAGYRLTDDPEEPLKWVFPSVVLPAKGFMVVFASDKDRRGGPYFHTNFQIKSGGETLVLYDPAGTVCDSLCNVVFTGDIATDISRGRMPDGGPDFVFFDTPTPGVSNAGGYAGFAGDVEASVESGTYDSPFTVTLSTVSPTAVIRYATGGRVPTEMSTTYTGPIAINGTTILRARAFSMNYLPGAITTKSYLFNADHELPVISLVTEPSNFFDDKTGIYVLGDDADPKYPFGGANFYEDWERPVHVDLIEPGGGGFGTDAGIKISGGVGTRWYGQKSLAIFMRNEYGAPVLDYQLFPDHTLRQYWSFKLRNGGQNWSTTLFKDGLTHQLMHNTHIDLQAYRPSVVYLNGAYWGIHNIREKLNEEYLASHHGVDPDRVDILEYVYPDTTATIVEGEADHYQELLAYVDTHDLAVDEHYDYVLTQVDVDNYIDYMIIQTYIGNIDWPDNNTKFWRPRTPNGRWRWVLFDTDFGFPDGVDSFDYPHLSRLVNWNGPQVRLFNRLRHNDRFRVRFINRYYDLINTLFTPETVVSLIDAKRAEIYDEMPRHISKWGEYADAIPSMKEWERNVTFLRTYAENRHEPITRHVSYTMNNTPPALLTADISPPGSGTVLLNTIVLENFPFNGVYAAEVPVTLTAIPEPGFRFAGWDGTDAQGPIAEVIMSDGIALTARFEADGSLPRQVSITEINYNSSPLFSPGDWVELYNPRAYPVDISGWRLNDESTTGPYVLPPNTVIPGRGLLILSEYELAFRELYPEVAAVLGNLPFDLSNGGETLILADRSGTVIDSVSYRDTDPWPETPDGNGPTLVLRDAVLDNAIAASWDASEGFGAPGTVTDTGAVAVEEPDSGHPEAYLLGQNVPNPFNPTTAITFTVPQPGSVTLTVFNITGQKVATLVDGFLPTGVHRTMFDGGSFSSGIYFYRLSAQGFRDTRRMVLVK